MIKSIFRYVAKASYILEKVIKFKVNTFSLSKVMMFFIIGDHSCPPRLSPGRVKHILKDLGKNSGK